MMTIHLSFRVFGKVQGVFFRNYTVSKAKELQLVGYVSNLEDGSVYGIAEGSETSILNFKHWLCHTGSPMSEIKDAIFTEKEITTSTFKDFSKLKGIHPIPKDINL